MDNHESDAESFSEELSPTDGYFNPRNYSPDIVVEDPSYSSSKTSEVASESRETSAQPLLSRERRTIGLHAFSESSPLLDAGPPPPAYSAAIATPFSTSTNTNELHSTSYGGTAAISPFETQGTPQSMTEPMQIEEGSLDYGGTIIAPFNTQRGPQNMTAPVGIEGQERLEAPLWRRRRERRWRSQLCKTILHSCFATIGIVLVVLILVLVFTSNWFNVFQRGALFRDSLC